MSILSKVRTLFAVALKPSILTTDAKYLFILSHMRSRSSVLAHVLGSNDGICGYSELHHSYAHYKDIIKMRIKLYDDLQCDLKGKYLLDKLLHNKLDVSESLLESVSPKIIFLLRDPESTIKSTVRLGQLTGEDWYADPEQAAQYYCSRLSRLQEYAGIADGNYFFLESDDLVNNTDSVLRDLTTWLGLHTPLDHHYSTFKKTGKSGYGDPSEKILAGKIEKTATHSTIEIPPRTLQIAESSYEKCRTALLQKASKPNHTIYTERRQKATFPSA